MLLKKIRPLMLLVFTLFCGMALAEGANPKVLLETSAGNIMIELDAEKAPLSVQNFITYVNDKHYDATIFHRVIKNFMVQGGGYNQNMVQKSTRAPIKNEANNGLKNVRGSVAMARTNVVDSATSQFFINHKDNTFLDHGSRDYGYAVFGRVIEGMDVVDAIANTPTLPGDRPVEAVLIKQARLVTP